MDCTADVDDWREDTEDPFEVYENPESDPESESESDPELDSGEE